MQVKRTFIPGEEWLYYKIYCGARTSDSILINTIYPLMKLLIKKRMIDLWFFIRYHDPDAHIKLRLHVTDIRNIADIMQSFSSTMQSYVTDDIIYKIQLDTYYRELERYGANTIHISEELFYHESNMLLESKTLIEDENLYFLFIMKTIDQFLNSCNYEMQEKLSFAVNKRDAFKIEFNADKTLNKQLDQKYRKIKNDLSNFLKSTYSQNEFNVLDKIINTKEKVTIKLIQEIINHNKEGSLEVRFDYLIGSHIHMLVNRAFRSRQRFYELVIYDLFCKYYKSDYIKNSLSINS
ncbi:thiopeptide-type bacteriocin biosynthesis protein [Aquimarina latercula]|uniref:thiopeptide-type bacteriocin biosynthesis protein n=1 Tax=Aquimarina latercula TaxID=987 RepID=UPI000485814C|nr:thiopeptide-type bacteriocin biosynthesis protein [Aquimarina latercula]